MTEHDDDLTTQLTRSLTDRSDVMSGTSFGLAEVKGRARSLRRRRMATAVVGAAAAVAVIIPTVALASHTGGSNNEPAPITQTPSPTQAATDDGHQPSPGVLDVSDLPTGGAPSIEYVTAGKVLHQVDGSTVDIPTRQPVSSFAVLSNGTHVWQTADDRGHAWIEVEDAAGQLQAPLPSTFGLSVTRSHDAAAWVQPNGQVMVMSVGATEPLAYGDPVPAGDDLRMGPFLGDDCGGPADSCEVYVNVSQRAAPQPWVVSVNGTEPARDGGYLFLADATESGLSVGYTKLTDSGSCSRLLGGGEFQGFQTCQHTLTSLSPDGRLILADPAYHDGIGNGVIAMYDLEGNRLFDRHSTEDAQSFYPGAEWEDDTHVLAPVFQAGQWSIVRVASDSSMEYAVPPVAGEDVANPFVLSVGGLVLGD